MLTKFFFEKEKVVRTLFYSRQQGNTLYEFFKERGKLVAEYSRDGEKVRSLLIKGIPFENQRNLHDPKQLYQLYKMLDHSFFISIGGDIHVNLRGLGGWKEKIHDNKTKNWALEAGFTQEEAKEIGVWCNSIDITKDPIKHFKSPKKQGWHFNTTEESTGDGNENDTRIKNAIKRFNYAISQKDSHQNHARLKGGFIVIPPPDSIWPVLRALGEGLHPLQDIFAHTEKFVHRLGGVKYHWFEPFSGADKPKYIEDKDYSPKSLDKKDRCDDYSQRYTNTKVLTLFYLKCFREKRTLTCKELSVFVKEALEFTKYKYSCHGEAEEYSRFQSFQQKLNSFSSSSVASSFSTQKDLASVNKKLDKLMEQSQSGSSTLFRTDSSSTF